MFNPWHFPFNLSVAFPRVSKCSGVNKCVYDIRDESTRRDVGEASWCHPVFSCRIKESVVSFEMGEEVEIDGILHKYMVHSGSYPYYRNAGLTLNGYDKVELTLNGETIVFGKGDLFSGAIYYKEDVIYYRPFIDRGMGAIIYFLKRRLGLYKKESMAYENSILPEHPVCKKYARSIFYGILLYRMTIDARDFEG